jgi:nitroreductase
MSIPHKPASTEANLHEVLKNRWSTRAYDKNYVISDGEILSILEAARWSPSSKNSQPWKFLAAKRGDKNFEAFVSTLTGFNLEWAPNASAIILVAAHGNPVTNDEIFDAGLAVSSITFQIHALGLHAHQMAGFSKSKLKAMFNLDDSIAPLVLVAVGKITNPDELSKELQERELSPRTRKSLNELMINGLN